MRRVLAVVVILAGLTALSPGPGICDETNIGSEPGPADLSWMAGHWQGVGLGGECEVFWESGPNSRLVGMFRYMKDGQIVFYEFLCFDRHDGAYALRLKHFNPDLTGWEHKDTSITFPYISSSRGELVCDGVTHRLIGPDSMEVAVMLQREDGESGEVKVRYRRVATCPAEVPANSTPVRPIAIANWLAGCWGGEAFGGVCREIWCGSAGGAMMGLFKLAQGDQPVFYELMTIIQTDDGLALKLKHFNPDLTGWEEKDSVITFPPLGASTGKIRFDGLSYAVGADQTLHIVLSTVDADHKATENTIDLLRQAQ